MPSCWMDKLVCLHCDFKVSQKCLTLPLQRPTCLSTRRANASARIRSGSPFRHSLNTSANELPPPGRPPPVPSFGRTSFPLPSPPSMPPSPSGGGGSLFDCLRASLSPDNCSGIPPPLPPRCMSGCHLSPPDSLAVLLTWPTGCSALNGAALHPPMLLVSDGPLAASAVTSSSNEAHPAGCCRCCCCCCSLLFPWLCSGNRLPLSCPLCCPPALPSAREAAAAAGVAVLPVQSPSDSKSGSALPTAAAVVLPEVSVNGACECAPQGMLAGSSSSRELGATVRSSPLALLPCLPD